MFMYMFACMYMYMYVYTVTCDDSDDEENGAGGEEAGEGMRGTSGARTHKGNCGGARGTGSAWSRGEP